MIQGDQERLLMGVWLMDIYPFAGLVLFFLCSGFYIFCHHFENFVLPVMSLLYIGCLLIRIFLAYATILNLLFRKHGLPSVRGIDGKQAWFPRVAIFRIGVAKVYKKFTHFSLPVF